MADFNFFLNRQGVRGNKGEQGEQGYSPRITVKTETAAEYVLNVQNEDGSFDTPNLRGNAIENLGGTYVRFDQDTEQMYTGYADTASTTSQGEVVLSTYADLDAGGDESEVTTSKDVHDFVEAKINEASVNYVDIDDYTQKMNELDGEISDLDDNKLDFTDLSNTLVAGTNITITPNAQTGKITVAGEPVDQAQADWNQDDTDAPDYIKNKPTIPEAITVDDDFSTTSTNPVENRLITNAINLISNELEDFAEKDLSNLSTDGEARLHALKAYSDNGEILTDAKGLSDVINYAHSSFDSSKFTVVGSPNITDDGVASGFSSSNYLTANLTFNPTNQLRYITTFTTGSDITTNQRVFRFYNNLTGSYQTNQVRVQNGSLEIFVAEGKSVSWAIEANTTYTVIIEWTSQVGYFVINLIKPDGTVLTQNKTDATTTMQGNNSPIGIGNGADAQVEGWSGSIDLKQFSITVDNIPVFSGNKTGIDTIKPDDYTVVGSPTITADGITSGFSESNYLTISNGTTLTKDTYFKFYCTFTTPASWTKNGRFWGASTNNYFGHTSSGVLSANFLGVGLSTSIEVLATNTKYDVIFVYDETGFYEKHKKVTETTWTSRTPVSVTSNTSVTIGDGWIGNQNNGLSAYYTGAIDLSSYKFYVGGNLVYQPCLKIPYTESKTGSKIVSSPYRDRVNDMAEQFGSANYYTLDEVNGDFTLPQVELYGLIEKAASTVPSGVVQSSSINNIVSLTQAEYDALVTKDANTFYIITPSS